MKLRYVMQSNDKRILDEIIEIVNNLNDAICVETIYFLEIKTDGLNFVVTFLDQIIWNSENDIQKCDKKTNEYKLYYNSIKKEYNKIIFDLNKQKIK